MGCIWRLIKAFLMLVGFITVVIAIILGVCVWQLTQPSSLEKEMRPIELTEEEIELYADSFDDKIDALEEELLLLAPGAAVTVTFSEEEVTAKIIEAIDEAAIPLDISDVWVNFTDDDRVLILGKVNVGLTLSAGLELEMTVENFEPKITGSELAVGRGFGIPSQAKDAVASIIPTDEALTDMLKGLPMDVTEIDLREGQITFEGKKSFEV